MKKLLVFVLACASAAEAPMGNTTDWYTFGGDSLRDGWEKNEQRFTKDDVKTFRLLWQYPLSNPKLGVGQIMPPVVLGRLIGYRGFKELAFVAGSANSVWSIDSDLNKLYWQKNFSPEEKAKPKRTCTANLTAAPALPGPVVFHAPVPGQPPAKPRPVNKFGGARPVFLLTGDGMLRQLHQSDGSDFAKPRPFVPEGVSAQPLNVVEDVIYTSTRSGCGHEAAVWSLDTTDPESKPRNFKLGADIAGMMGVVVTSDSRVFVQTDDGPLDPDKGKYGGALLSLNKDMTLDQYFVMPQGTGKKESAAGMNITSPLLFTFKGAELVVTTGKDGRLYVLKSSDLGTSDHHHYLSQSMVIPAMDEQHGHGIWGALATWEDTEGSRFVLASVWGPLSAEMKAAVPDTNAPNGAIVAFKMLDGPDGQVSMKPIWVSRDMDTPAPPVIAKGVIFALSNGKFSNLDRNPKAVKKSHATLYALDAMTGSELYSTADQVAAAGNLAGLTVANGRVYFVTTDNTLQVFGKYLEP